MALKSAFIALLGRANVGKSTLINTLIGQKVAIVSDKPQTTRTRIMGVITKGDNQFVFIDTPGFHKPKNLLDSKMNNAISGGISDVDAAVLVIDAAPAFRFDPDNLPAAELQLLESIKAKNLPCILAVNKIDLLPDKEDLLGIIAAYSRGFDFKAVVPISAKSGDGTELLMAELDCFLKKSPHYFSADDYTDQPDKVMVAEIIREKLLALLEKEVPHGVAVDIERFFETDNSEGKPVINIDAVIYCERESHKGIIIGKGGLLLKHAGTLARRDLENFFGAKVALKLWVKVKEDWRNREGIIRALGLDSLT